MNIKIIVAGLASILGGLLIFISWVWQGYLSITSDNHVILFDEHLYSSEINNYLLFVSTLALLLGMKLFNHHLNKYLNRMIYWKTGYYFSLLSMTIFLIALFVFFLKNLVDLQIINNLIIPITAFSHIILHFSAFLIGMSLLGRYTIFRISGIFFIIQFFVVLVILTGFLPTNPFFVSLAIGSWFGFAWIFLGVGAIQLFRNK